MYFCFLFCMILFIPRLHGNSLSTPSAINNVKSSNETVESPAKNVSESKLTLITEGGSVEPETPLAALPERLHPKLINLDEKPVKTKVQSVVPRKGVQYNPIEGNSSDINYSKEVDAKFNPTAEETLLPKLSTKSDVSSHLMNNTIEPKQLLNKTLNVPKKPLVVSAEAINETDRKAAMEKAKLGTSSKPIVRDQMPLPKVKYEQMSTNSHPGMVMPIVITMLVVPMFVVLGYMALRQGQEAWKNRHYKRMDFLLDGMYND